MAPSPKAKKDKGDHKQRPPILLQKVIYCALKLAHFLGLFLVFHKNPSGVLRIFLNERQSDARLANT